MKLKNILTITLLSSQLIIAQTQIENGGFESWENSTSDTQEPLQWSSLKTSDDDSWLNLANSAPQVIWKETTDTHSGSSCIKLKVAPYNSLVGISPNAIVTNGRVFASTTPSEGYVFTDATDSQWNTACSDRPDSLVGWYKYAPQSNDNGRVEILFHTTSNPGELPEFDSYSHWVGNGTVGFSVAKSSWTRFSFPIDYTTTALPTHFLIISSAGNGLNAVEGSELFLDDMSFIYNPPVGIIETKTSGNSITAYDSEINIELKNDFNIATIKLFSLDGKLLLEDVILNKVNKIQYQLTNGIYIYQLTVDGETTSGKIGL